MKKYVIPAVLAIVVLIVILTASCSDRRKSFELLSGDVIPTSAKLFRVSGESYKISDVKSKYKVIFYLNSNNEESIKRLDCISKTISLLSCKDISYLLVWEDRIPVEDIQKAGIDESYNYSLKQKVSLSESKPTAFLMNENNKIIMVTGYSYISLINELINLNGKTDLSKKAGKMIVNNVSKSGDFSGNHDGKILLMFMSSGCKICRVSEDIVSKNIDAMGKKINTITVRPDFDTRHPYDKNFEIDPQQIYFNVFSHEQGIQASNRKYPMFLIINSDYSVEKLFTDASEVVNYILGL
ncbi:hypothetical protein [Ruminiclostridium cellulolyticum]|uniref:Thioredoxin-like fold domain-containing protein n=1 Tax=Ruminiclostridium cellulolyticum (strain ATCC 35319 / DSM 5812 / JCM 6584 / H10) TaxID=394503 RepID=B8I0M4_RUMCH|nr:hypothetical protein [Ruminiclostridium cellulolyticum]ACL75599.1 hypothetical protein Ccel_1243 [Ruminiclostridium cellulolyticum H10]